ncbi:MAG: proline--tRNA ligase [bacterium]|nr:proline--tRNA ligase [bacterium]MDD5354401.1 proline--tRNA ligase [bacterium]
MRLSQSFIPTMKEIPSEAQIPSHQLMLRAGMIRKLSSGVYEFLPLGFKILKKVEQIIREEMNAAGAQELLLPALHPKELWEETGRWEIYGDEMMKVIDRNKRQFGLGPTHEEVITDLVRKEVKSYRQLPVILYQFQTKFRDEIRPRFGIMRGREFIMKDCYSFDKDEAGLNINYQKMVQAYKNIFTRCGFDFRMVQADSGNIGGNLSHEFMVLANTGEEAIYYCDACQVTLKANEPEGGQTASIEKKSCTACQKEMKYSRVIEVGHTFNLGTKYSAKMKATFLDENGESQPYIMGCYGIGVSRIVAAAIEQSHDANGIIWPRQISPYQAIVLPLDVTNEPVKNTAEDLYAQLQSQGIDVLLDDRDERAGVKFKDADLIGIPVKVIISIRGLAEGKIEIKLRQTGEVFKLSVAEAVPKIMELVQV